jgi:hypothetical protein
MGTEKNCFITDDPSDTTTEGKNKNLGKKLQITPYVSYEISGISRDDDKGGWKLTYT